MTNEELDRARVDEAIRIGNGIVGSVALIAARLAREGWTPPVTVDPDLAEAERLAYAWHVNEIKDVYGLALAGIKRGRALAAAEAKPGLVWLKHDGSDESPVNKNWFVAIFRRGAVDAGRARLVDWRVITHYAVITCPFEDVA